MARAECPGSVKSSVWDDVSVLDDLSLLFEASEGLGAWLVTGVTVVWVADVRPESVARLVTDPLLPVTTRDCEFNRDCATEMLTALRPVDVVTVSILLDCVPTVAETIRGADSGKCLKLAITSPVDVRSSFSEGWAVAA